MGDITKGTTFTDSGAGAAVNAARLHQLVENATITAVFYSSKADASSEIADGDKFLILQLSSGEYRTVDVAALATRAAAITSAADPLHIGPDAPDASFQDGLHAWIKSSAGVVGGGGLRLWDAADSKWVKVYSMPVGAVTGYLGAGNFDGDGVGQGGFDGWGKCDGNGGRANIPDAGDVHYMQFIGYT